MSERDQLIAMLDQANILYSLRNMGAYLYVYGSCFHFSANGSLKSVEHVCHEDDQ